MSDSLPVIYGLAACDTCRKARNWLTRKNVVHRFVDYREHRVPAETLKAWARDLGGWDRLINRQSTTWRNLPEARRQAASDPEYTLLVKEYPQLVRRPVLVLPDGRVQIGFTDKLYAALLGV